MSTKSVFLFIFLLILPVTGFTLGFGNLTVFSKLNEPLKIHINIIGSKSVTIDDIVVKNAGISTYKQANIPKPSAFNKVRFKTIKEANGSIIIELTTKKPVKEPFFTFIADMKWRTGHLNREYTFLLDPPDFIYKKSYPKKQKKVTAKKPNTSKTLTSRKPGKIKQRTIDYSAVIASHADGDTYGPTRRADTLWDIAKKVKPDNNVTTHQTMQALFALNPDAFIKGNINLLKQGQTLKLPTSNEVRQVNGKPLLKEVLKLPVKSTSDSSSTSKQVNISRVIERPSDSKEEAESNIIKTNKTEDKAQLKILLPTEELLNAPVSSADDLLLINKALQTSISTIKSLQSENQGLSKQIAFLTDKLNSLDEHNEKLNIKISEITTSLKNNKNTHSNQSTNTTTTTNSDESLSKLSDINTTKTPLKIDSDLAETPANRKKSFVRELLTSPAITFALTLFTIIVLVTALFTIRNYRAKRQQKRQETDSDNTRNKNIISRAQQRNDEKSNTVENNKATNTYSNSLQGTDISDEKDEDDMDFFEYFEKKINAPDETISSKSLEAPPTSETEEISFDLDISADDLQEYNNNLPHSDKSSQNTILSEIDTYLAYGNYNEAEKLLIREIKKSPSDKNLHLKLFECYTISNKRYEFIQHAERIINLLNMDMVLRHRIENRFQQTWNETLDLRNI